MPGERLDATAPVEMAGKPLHLVPRWLDCRRMNQIRLSAFIGSSVVTVPELLADLSGPWGGGHPEGAAQSGPRSPHME